MTSSPSEVYASVDWLTLTTGADDDAQPAYELARSLAVEQESAGQQIRTWGAHGYKGFGTPHLRAGEKDGDVLVELSGELADRYWRMFLGYAKSISRIDTYVDVRHAHSVAGLAEQAYYAPGVRIIPHLPPIHKSLVVGSDGGSTCYVGKLGGRRLGRLYDKHVESRGDFPPGTWRYELQERSPISGVVARGINRTDDVPRSVAAHVHHFYSVHGIEPWFQSDSDLVPGQHGKSRSDVSAWLNWVRSQVAPGVRRWSRRGHADAIRAALALDEERRPS